MRHDLNCPEAEVYVCRRCEERFYASGPDSTCPHCGAQDATLIIMQEELEEEYNPG